MSDVSRWLQLTGSQADLVAAASSGNLQALNSMSTGNLAGLTANAGLSQSQVCSLCNPLYQLLLMSSHQMDCAIPKLYISCSGAAASTMAFSYITVLFRGCAYGHCESLL